MKKWRYGIPIPTGAVVDNIPQALDVFVFDNKQVLEQDEVSFTWTIPLSAEAQVLGLGQNLGGINKRGRKYISFCTDDPHHTEDKEALYAAHNVLFIVEGSGETQMLFWDTPGRIVFDIAFTDESQISVRAWGRGADLYSVTRPSVLEAVVAFRKLIGKPYMPPKWAFGYFQSRWGYQSEGDLREVQENFSKHDIPLEGIYVDIDYMERFKDFTINTSTYPDFKGLVTDFKGMGQRLIPIIDAGVKIEPDYPLYEEGIKGDHFVKDQNDVPYVAAVWPGRVHFPDFMRPETQVWFGDWYKYLIDMGIEGIWNDMNEPAIFYDETALADAIEHAMASKDVNLDIYSYFSLGDAFRGLSNKEDYYLRMQHSYEGENFNNRDIHNLYGYLMTKSAAMGFDKHLPDTRPLILSRASSVGMHRYGGIWTGDNSSWWSHLALNVKQMPSLSAVGFLYSGADTGGFGGNASGELLSRWLQFSIFTPLLRNHAALGTRHQEPYQFGDKATLRNRSIIQTRYRLLPFLYSEFLKAYHLDLPLFSPLQYYYRDPRVKQIEDQIFIGEGVMLIPVVSPNVAGRMVYLPEPMTLVTISAGGEVAKDYPAGDHYIDYPLDSVQCFLRPGYGLPLVKSAINTSNIRVDEVVWMGSLALAQDLGKSKVVYNWYDDDGSSKQVLDLGASIQEYSIAILDGKPIITEGSEGIELGSWHPGPESNHKLTHILR